jgi:hypothetical protein
LEVKCVNCFIEEPAIFTYLTKPDRIKRISGIDQHK